MSKTGYSSENATPITIDDLITGQHLASVHCSNCGHCRIVQPAEIPAPHITAVPDLSGRFRCSKCGSKSSTVMPYFDTQQRYGRAE